MARIISNLAADATGQNTLVAAPGAGRRLEIQRIQLTTSTDGAGNFEDTDGTGFIGSGTVTITILAGVNYEWDFRDSPEPIPENVGLVLDLVAAVTSDVVVIVDFDDVRIP